MFKSLVNKVISVGHIKQEIKAGELYVESIFTKAFPRFFEKVEGKFISDTKVKKESVETKVNDAIKEAKETITEKVEAIEEKGKEILKDESSEVVAAEEKIEETVEEIKGKKGKK